MRSTFQFQQATFALLLSFSASVAFAGNVASEQVDSGGLTLTPTISYDVAGLRVSSENYDVTTEYASGESIRVDAGSLDDGVYGYELSLATAASESAPNGSSVQQRGGFYVQGGITLSNEEKMKQTAVEALSRQVYEDSDTASTIDL